MTKDIAIVGIGLRLPGEIHGPEGLWNALVEGRDCITDIPNDRWNIEKYYDPDPNKIGKIKTKRGGFIKGMKEFDADFFDIYPRVAHTLDPRQRHLLEVTYEAIEDAGLTLDKISGSETAVIIGVFLNDETKKIAGSDLSAVSSHAVMGTIDTSVSARVAFQFNLKGPTLSVDTACSSSLVAIQLACNSIWMGDAKMAIAGGVNIMSGHEHTLQIAKGNFLSSDGYCKSFDISANGYVRSEGAGVVILKPLEQAKIDGDNIYAVVKSAVVNSDGYTKDGMTVPCEFAQLEMLKKAYYRANINPADVDFIEAHGTGTPVGDPKECWSFGNIFAENRSEKNPLIIGSIKSNLGHTEAVAGVAGFVKLALCLKNKQIPKNLHFKEPNPAIKFDEWKLKVCDKLMEWPQIKNKKAIGGVNSFGAGGTNAHVVMEAFEDNSKEQKKIINYYDFSYLFVISARSEQALTDLVKKYINFLSRTEYSIEDISYSSLTRRSIFERKIFIATNSKQHLKTVLEKYLNNSQDKNLFVVNAKNQSNNKIAFVFSGQGSQWYAMGRQLIKKCKIYSDTLERIDSIFKQLSGFSLLEEILKSKENSRIGETVIDQPAIMALQIGLVEMYKSIGINPEGSVGHSVGEVAAAYCAGVLDLEQAVKVIYFRSKEQDKAANIGKMLAVELKHQDASKRIEKYQGKVSVAVVNSPNTVVLSGDKEIIEEISHELTKENIFNKILKVNIAFHSYHMDVTKENLIKNLENLTPKEARIALYSSVTGNKENGKHFNNQYCYKNVRQEVLFSTAIQKMINDDFNCFVEISPHPILSSAIIDSAAVLQKEIEVISTLNRNIDDFENKIDYENINFLFSVAKLFVLKTNIYFEPLFNNNVKYVKLPNYAWQHSEYWSESKEHEEARLGKPKYPFINFRIDSLSNKHNKIWDLNFNKKYQTFLKDHRIDGEVVVPGTAQVEVAYEIAKRVYDTKFSHIENINFPKALFLPNEDAKVSEARLEITSDQGDYKIYSRLDENEDWVNNGNGKICFKDTNFNSSKLQLSELQNRLINSENKISTDEFYSRIKEMGLNYGSNFRLVKEMWQFGNEKLAKIELSDDHLFQKSQFNLMPNISDACLHIILKNPENGLFLPDVFGKYKIYTENSISKIIWSYTNILESNSNYIIGEALSFNNLGEKILEVKDIKLKYLQNSNANDKISENFIYEFQWNEKSISPLNTETNNNESIVIFCDQEFSIQLIKELESKKPNIIKVIKGENFTAENDTLFTINSNVASDFQKLFDVLKTKKINYTKIINLWNIDYYVDDKTDTEKFIKLSSDIISQNLYLFQEIAKFENEIFLYQITKNADLVFEKDKKINLLQGGLYGMGRVFLNEYPSHQIRMIDIGCSKEIDNVKSLFNEIFKDEKKPYETEVAIRDYGRFVRKLIKNNPNKQKEHSVLCAANERYYNIETIGSRISFIEDAKSNLEEKSLPDNCVIINAKYFSFTNSEFLTNNSAFCTIFGTIEKTGSAVKTFKKGDKVIAISLSSPTGKIILDHNLVIHKPDGISDLESSYFGLAYFIKDLPNSNLKIKEVLKSVNYTDLAKTIKEILFLDSSSSLSEKPHIKTYKISELSNFINKGLENNSVIEISGEIPLLPSQEIHFKSNSTYIITGGATGLGIVITKWMFKNGARNFVLISRSGPKYQSDFDALEEMKNAGARIEYEVSKIDITNPNELRKVISYTKNNMPELKGIIHSAGLLDDASYMNMNIEKFLKIYNPKATGAWNLHRETLDCELDFFVSISSVSSIIGIAGQSNYSTANNLLNYLSIYRNINSKNTNNKSACFGVLSSEFAGMSKETKGAEELTYKTIGTLSISKELVESALEKLLLSDNPYLMLSPMNWDNFRKSNLDSENRFIFSDLLQINNNKIKTSADLKESIINTKSELRNKKVIEILKNFLSDILGIDSKTILDNKSITNIGLDSLMLNQFRNKIKSELDINLPLMKLAKGPSINELSEEIIKAISNNSEIINEVMDITGIESDSDLEVSPSKWFVRKKSLTKTKVKIFCLHPVGAGASIFSYFMFNPPKDAEVIALQMPGRENRINEDHYYSNMADLIQDISNQIIPEIDTQVVFWGHSWGGVTLYEILKYLRKNNIEKYNNVKHLVISGSIAPQLTLLWKDRDSIKETANSSNSVDRILSTLSYIDDLNYLKNILPIMRKDMEMIMTYQYKHEEKLDIPITAFAAIEDEVVLLEELQQWKEQTTNNFNLFQVHGDHWFLSRNREFISDKINELLKKL